ncbi:hypothetical protein DB333_07075 [Levilactobacillus brevis]|nr:hypothetical protein DB333_07075 [Levilactobacillus brevis]
MVNTILKEADLFCPNSVRINFTIYHNKALKTPSQFLIIRHDFLILGFTNLKKVLILVPQDKKRRKDKYVWSTCQ